MKQETTKIKPYKGKHHRHQLPFRKGQGVRLGGWQFEIKSVQQNGTLNLRCIGKIIEMSEFANMPKKIDGPPDTNEGKVPLPETSLPYRHNLEPLPVVNPCPKCGTEVPDKSYPFTQCPKCLHVINNEKREHL